MDLSALKRWMYLVVIMSVVLVGCWASVPTTEAEDGHGRDREHERHPVTPARDPGVRGGMPGGGGSIVGLTARELEFFADAKTEFEGAEGVADGSGRLRPGSARLRRGGRDQQPGLQTSGESLWRGSDREHS